MKNHVSVESVVDFLGLKVLSSAQTTKGERTCNGLAYKRSSKIGYFFVCGVGT